MVSRIGLGALLAVVLLAGESTAGLLPVNVGITPDGDDYRYTYSVHLQSGAALKPGDYFTIFDFAGLIDGSNLQPAGFTFSSIDSGPTPSRVHPDDDPGISNVTWTYSGAETIGPSDLGDFSVASQFSSTTDDSFTGQTHREADGLANSNITDTHVPVPSATHCHHVPEPPTMFLLVVSVPLALSVRMLRRYLLI